MIHAAPLDLDNLAESDDTSLAVNLDVFSYWYENGYPVDGIVEAYCVVNVKRDNENTGHTVLKVETLSKPLDKADVVADQTEVWACDCKGYQHHYSVDLEDTPVTEWDACPHIEACDKSAKAKNDDNQDTLL